MGGKTLKFPKRRKYVPPIKKSEKSEEDKIISEEEHKKRVQMLKEMGLLK